MVVFVETRPKEMPHAWGVSFGMFSIHCSSRMIGSVILLGIIEGITEFLPISSTGHLIFISNWLNMDAQFSGIFNVAIQLGAILAVIREYPKELASYVSHKFSILAVAVVPVLCLGLLFHDVIKQQLFSPRTVFWALIIGGIALIVSDVVSKHRTRNDTGESMSFRQALIIGACQCAALWPGMSRSGSTIIGGLIAGASMTSATKFSFIIAVPVMIAAVSYDMLLNMHHLTVSGLGWIGFGGLISFCVATATIRWFLRVIHRVGLIGFGVYRILLGAFGLVFFG